MNQPLHNIQDDRQLDYVIEAIDKVDYELAIAQHLLLSLFHNPKDAYDALMHLRALVQNFVRTGLGIVDGSEGEDDE